MMGIDCSTEGMIMLETYELGPTLNTAAPDFQLYNDEHTVHSLANLMGVRGVLLGFVANLWMPTSIRRVFWLQRNACQFALSGAPVALVVRDQPQAVYGFHMSSPFPVQFPMLADVEGLVHRLYRMQQHPGLVLLDHQQRVRCKWLMPDERVWPSMKELVETIESLPEC